MEVPLQWRKRRGRNKHCERFLMQMSRNARLHSSAKSTFRRSEPSTSGGSSRKAILAVMKEADKFAGAFDLVLYVVACAICSRFLHCRIKAAWLQGSVGLEKRIFSLSNAVFLVCEIGLMWPIGHVRNSPSGLKFAFSRKSNLLT